jgi:hypothetical protein
MLLVKRIQLHTHSVTFISAVNKRKVEVYRKLVDKYTTVENAPFGNTKYHKSCYKAQMIQRCQSMEGLPFLVGGGINLTGLQIVDITRTVSYFFRHGFNNFIIINFIIFVDDQTQTVHKIHFQLQTHIINVGL